MCSHLKSSTSSTATSSSGPHHQSQLDFQEDKNIIVMLELTRLTKKYIDIMMVVQTFTRRTT